MAIKSISNTPEERVESFLKLFSMESPAIREELANSLPSYNILVSLHAKTFEEFSLKQIAEKQGVNYSNPLFSYKDVTIPCVRCGSTDRIIRVNENSYVCKSCNKKFTLNPNSICSNTNCSSLTWMKVLYCLLESYSVKRACNYCNISPETYYNIRTKLFYAMQLMLDEVKLYGVIECDNTFVRMSYKGYNLEDEEFPEGSPLDIIDFVPRSARKRGERNTYKTRSVNMINIFTAIDDHGHCIARYVGIGSATATKLQRAVTVSKYLFSIPSKDPFAFTAKAPSTSEPIQNSLLVSDEEAAIRRYATILGIPHEAHVYSEAGKHKTLPDGAHNIQRVNALHHRLKTFLRKTNYVSAKYLPGYLTLFEFIENTGATQEAIGRLFEILTTPGLGKSPGFYKNLYTIPNLYVECGNENLKKLKHNQLLAAFMYHQKLEAEATGEPSEIVMADILTATGYSSPSNIRRIYKNIVSSGLMDAVCKAMTSPEKIIKEETKRAATPQIPEYILKYYDEMCTMKQLPPEERCSLQKLIEKLNQEYGKNVTRTLFYYYIDRIEELNLRPVKLSKIMSENRKKALSMPLKPPSRSLEILQVYNEIRASYASTGKPIPVRTELLNMVAQKVNLSSQTVAKYISKGKKIKKNQLK